MDTRQRCGPIGLLLREIVSEYVYVCDRERLTIKSVSIASELTYSVAESGPVRGSSAVCGAVVKYTTSVRSSTTLWSIGPQGIARLLPP